MTETEEIRAEKLCGDQPTGDDKVGSLLHALALARGCRTEAEIATFLDPSPRLYNPILDLKDLAKAVDRVVKAFGSGEAITAFSDYDTDGVTSCAQMVSLIRAAGHKNYHVYIPDRFIEDYGLTPAAVERCIETQKPSLIIAMDCGSTALEALKSLKMRGVDVIVMDHHQVPVIPDHPAFAHLNPKGDPRHEGSPVLQDAGRMCAAGLTFFFCSMVAKKANIPWDVGANLLLAGLGTYVDVMPLTGINRVLVKQSLRLVNDKDALARVPGIQALLQANSYAGKPVNDYTYGFILGPCLNATGRLDHARHSLSLLCSASLETAGPRARVLVESNAERKKIQEGILKEAVSQAQKMLAASPETKVLVLYGREWHAGVVGIVAGRIKEMFNRPAIVMAHIENGFWKGSGRSVPTIDIGRFVTQAAGDKVITGGGGHAMACGVKLTDEQLPGFVAWVKEQSAKITADMRPSHEIIGDLDWLNPDEWAEFFRRGAPFGQGNPKPALMLSASDVVWGPQPLTKANGAVVMQACYATKTNPALTVNWDNMERARAIFGPEQDVRLVIAFSRSFGQNGRVYDNWNVIHGEIATRAA